MRTSSCWETTWAIRFCNVLGWHGGNNSCITGPLWRESTSYRCITFIKVHGCGFWSFLNKMLNKQSGFGDSRCHVMMIMLHHCNVNFWITSKLFKSWGLFHQHSTSKIKTWVSNHVHQFSMDCNYTHPVNGVATICHQVRWLRWGHPSLFHTATSLLIWYKMFCVRDISCRLIWMEFINMFSVYAQSRTHSRFNWWFIVVLTYNPSVLMFVEITDVPKL